LPRREMAALRHLVVVDELGEGLLGPTPRGGIELIREDAHGHGNGDTFRVEISELAPVLPVEPRARQRRVRQPSDRDVVEDIVARETFGLSLEDARDQLIAAGVVIEEIRRQAYR